MVSHTQPPANKTEAAFPLTMALVGGIFLSVCGYQFYDHWQFRKQADVAEGVVIRLKHNGSSKGTYVPVVRWHSPDGKAHIVEGNFGTQPSAYEVNERINVYYNRQDYGDAKLGGFIGQWGIAAMFGVFGAVTLFIAGGTFTAPRRKLKKQQWLQRYGRCVRAELIHQNNEVSPTAIKLAKWLDSRVEKTNLNKHSRSINAQWTDPQTRKKHRFILVGLADEVVAKACEDGYIDVLIDPKKSGCYLAKADVVSG
jgi:hypothetical protein